VHGNTTALVKNSANVTGFRVSNELSAVILMCHVFLTFCEKADNTDDDDDDDEQLKLMGWLHLKCT
jgi:hypothetical protein